MRVQTPLARLVVIRHYGQAEVSTGLFRFKSTFDRLGGGIGSGTCDNGNPAIDRFNNPSDHVVMLFVGQGCRLSGCTYSDNGMGTGFDVKLDQSLQRGVIHLTCVIKGCDQGHHAALKHPKLLKNRA